MAMVNIHDAKTHFSKLLRRVAAGEEVVIARAGEPVAKLVPLEGEARDRRFGGYAGRIRISDDFDAPLPDEILATFYGEDV